MTLAPLMNAAMPIPHHAVAATLAVAIGVAQLWLAKGTSRHRTLGYVWAGMIVFVAFTGFFIFETDVAPPFTYLSKPLSVLVLVIVLGHPVGAGRQGQGTPSDDDPAVLADDADRAVDNPAGAHSASDACRPVIPHKAHCRKHPRTPSENRQLSVRGD